MTQSSSSLDKQERSADELSQFLTFLLNDEMFAIGILHVKEILEWHHVTPVPMMPEFICGVINLRGAVVPVIDLCARLGGKPGRIDKRTCIVILEIPYLEEQQYISIMVDAVSEVADITNTDIDSAPGFGMKIRSDFLTGIGKINDQFVIVLNVQNVLSVDELAKICDLGQVPG